MLKNDKTFDLRQINLNLYILCKDLRKFWGKNPLDDLPHRILLRGSIFPVKCYIKLIKRTRLWVCDVLSGRR